jgi:hypothetical protein
MGDGKLGSREAGKPESLKVGKPERSKAVTFPARKWWTMTLKIAIGVACALLFLAPSGSHADQRKPGDFQLSLIRQYDLAVYRECRLNVVAFEGKVVAELSCVSSGNDGRGRPIPPLTAREELSLDAGKNLMSLVELSKLYDGGHVGGDSTPVDGVFEVLKLVSERGAVMVVTSNNPTFKSGSRQALLSALLALEKRLAASAGR